MENHRCNICNIMIETLATDYNISSHAHISHKHNLEKSFEHIRKNQPHNKDESIVAKWLMSQH